MLLQRNTLITTLSENTLLQAFQKLFNAPFYPPRSNHYFDSQNEGCTLYICNHKVYTLVLLFSVNIMFVRFTHVAVAVVCSLLLLYYIPWCIHNNWLYILLVLDNWVVSQLQTTLLWTFLWMFFGAVIYTFLLNFWVIAYVYVQF